MRAGSRSTLGLPSSGALEAIPCHRATRPDARDWRHRLLIPPSSESDEDGLASLSSLTYPGWNAVASENDVVGQSSTDEGCDRIQSR